MTMTLAWNTKCVIQGYAMVGMYYAGQKHMFDDGEGLGWNMKTGIFTTVVFLLVYWTNAVLDHVRLSMGTDFRSCLCPVHLFCDHQSVNAKELVSLPQSEG